MWKDQIADSWSNAVNKGLSFAIRLHSEKDRNIESISTGKSWSNAVNKGLLGYAIRLHSEKDRRYTDRKIDR